jgi:hypothetical protein
MCEIDVAELASVGGGWIGLVFLAAAFVAGVIVGVHDARS